MRMREAAAAVPLLATIWTPIAAQATRDRPTLVFTVSGAYLGGVGLWSVPDQTVDVGGPGLIDHFALSRSIKRTLGAGFSGTYYRGQHLGLSAEAFLLGLGYKDGCQLVPPAVVQDNVERCRFIDQQERSAAAVATSAGVVYRIAASEFISPFVRANVGFLINNQSPLLVVGETNAGAELVIYDDNNKGTRLRPAFVLGFGTTVALSPSYQLRWEVRDNLVGIQRVTGTTSGFGQVPPHETSYKHIFSLNIGLDVILERQRGRRY